MLTDHWPVERQVDVPAPVNPLLQDRTAWSPKNPALTLDVPFGGSVGAERQGTRAHDNDDDEDH